MFDQDKETPGFTEMQESNQPNIDISKYTLTQINDEIVYVNTDLLRWVGTDFLQENVKPDLCKKREDYKLPHQIITIFKKAWYKFLEGNVVYRPESTLTLRIEWIKFVSRGKNLYIPFITSPNLNY